MLPPTIIGDTFNTLTVAPPVVSSEGVDEATTRTDFAGAIQNLNQSRRSPSEETYMSLIRRGGAIPGLSNSSTVDLEADITNSARNQSISPTIPTSGEARIVPALAGDMTALSILLQLRRMMDVPPLMLYINPTSFSVTHTKIAQLQERSRYGYIYQAWGEELVKVSFSCVIGAFIAGKRDRSQVVASGVQYASKRDSASFQQLMAVFAMYQSSGYIQDTTAPATGRQSRANLLIGNTAIEYDQNVYVGHMDSFSYGEEEAGQNGGMKFEIDFTAIKVFDNSQASSSITPLRAPGSNFYNPSAARSPAAGSRLSRTFQGNGESRFFTAPTIGLPGSAGRTPAQPWAGATVGVSSETGEVVTTRRTGR
jgi:hypothetical protein